MTPDVVQIGNITLSETVFNALTTLAAVLIGALMSYFVATAAERRRWQQQKSDKFQEQRREAIALTLEWINPLRNALISASSLAGAYEQRDMDAEDFVRRWPSPLSELKDPPGHLRVLLPPDTYKQSLSIVRGLEDLKGYVLFHRPKTIEDQSEKFRTIGHKSDALTEALNSLEDMLSEEYKKTFR